MSDFKRNGSGYIDPTAYKALKNIEDNQDMAVREIWEVEAGQQTRIVVVIAVQERYCNVLTLKENKSDDKNAEVLCKSMMYTDPAMASYVFKDRFIKFIRVMKDEEFDDLMAKVSYALGFEMKCEDYEQASLETVNDLKMKLEGAERALDEEANKYNKLLSEVEAHRPMLSRSPEEVKEALELLDSLKTCKPIIASSEEVELIDEEKIQLKTERDLYKHLYEQTFERLIG